MESISRLCSFNFGVTLAWPELVWFGSFIHTCAFLRTHWFLPSAAEPYGQHVVRGIREGGGREEEGKSITGHN